jgi:two-component system, NtrC family, response regulator AtoC
MGSSGPDETKPYEGDAPSADTPLHLVVIVDGSFQTHALPPAGEVRLGRSSQCEIQIDHPTISRVHTCIELSPLRVRDLGSHNGTDLGGRRLVDQTPVALAVGDVIRLGGVTVIVQRAELRPAVAPATSAMAEIYRLEEQVAPSSLCVLIRGETGVGKELASERIHNLSRRAGRPFLKLNCAALAETLLESELFGHERGAFTGAVATKLGLLEIADGGSVFLDEVGDLPLALQAKLLRVLEDRIVMRVGALKPRTIDVRFIAATNRDLEAEIERGAFRADLYFRLSGATIDVPPLRDRVDEIEPLARGFVARASAELGRQAPVLAADAISALRAHAWPGNIRELRNVIERATATCGGGPIRAEHLPLVRSRRHSSVELAPTPPAPTITDSPASPATMKDEIAEIERRNIVEALASCGGNQTRAASLLGISRNTLQTRMNRFGIPRPKKL